MTARSDRPAVAALHGGYLTAARELHVSERRASAILAAVPFGPNRYRDALRLLAGESVDDLAAQTIAFTPLPDLPARTPNWVYRWCAAAARTLLRLTKEAIDGR